MVFVKSKKRKNKFPKIYFIFIGSILLTTALFIFIFTFTPVFKAEVDYQLNLKKSPPVSEIIPIDPEFSVVIPKINANTKVIKNVDPFDSKIYQPALTKGVAHAKDTATPDKPGNTFIFAHSAGDWYQANRYNAVFYLLKKLEPEDEIIVYYQSQKYTYTVNQTKLVKGDQLNYLSSSPNKNQLTLMTCWPPGTTLKRLVVVATIP